MCWSAVSKYRFYRFFRYFTGKWCNRRKQYGHIHHQRLKINTNRCFVFRFTQLFILTVIFAILVGHIEFKILTENAGLQSHIIPKAEEHNMSMGRKSPKKNYRRESAAIDIIKKAIMTSHTGFFPNFSKIYYLKFNLRVSRVVFE